MLKFSYIFLFKGNSLNIGKFFCYILRANKKRSNRLGYYDEIERKDFIRLKRFIEKVK